ncbi:5572_t:CDS:2 [Paraglomus occultum]|uniref:5572_t:CDS:1 n=1 Tax=Paraglomus occultum TaxID=144539 RepID=A0A9N8ZBZ3_9GLOM|nr:5572_t:CDS:2 [Paraglomus occultum]
MRSLKSKLTKTARPFCFKPSPTDRRFYTRDSSDPSKFRLKDTQWKKPATHDRDMNRLDLPIRDPIEAQRKPQRTQEELADVLQGFLHPNQHNSKSTARDIGSIRKSINSDTSYPRSGKPFKRFPSDRFASKDIRSPDGSSNWSTDRRYPKASQPLPFSRSPSRTDVPTPKRDWKSPRPPPWPKRLPAVEKPAQPWPRHDAPDQPFRAAPAPVTTPTPIQQPRPSVAPAVVDPQAPAEIIEPEVAAEEIDDLTDIGDVSRPKSKLVRRDEGRSKEGLSKRERFFKKKQEDELDDGLTYDELELSERKKEKKQTIKVEEKIKKEVYLPEAISVANLAKVIGLRLVLTSEVASLIALEYDLNPVINQDVAIDLFPK